MWSWQCHPGGLTDHYPEETCHHTQQRPCKELLAVRGSPDSGWCHQCCDLGLRKQRAKSVPKWGELESAALPRGWRGGVQPYFWEDISTWNGAAWRPLALPIGHQSRTWAEAQKIKLAVPSCSPQRLSKVPLSGASTALLALCPWLCSVLATSGATLVSRAALPLGSLTLFATQSHLSLKDFLSFKKSLPFHLFSVSLQIS